MTVALLNRQAFGPVYEASVSIAADAGRFNHVVLASVNTGLAALRKANPTLGVWMYLDPSLARPEGLTTVLQSAVDPSMCLCDQHGKPLVKAGTANDPEWITDPANPDYQQLVAETAFGLLIKYGWPHATAGAPAGVFLDDVSAHIGWWLDDAGIKQAYDSAGKPTYSDTDDATWQAAMLSLVAAVTASLHAAGYQVLGNIGGAGLKGYTGFFAAALGLLDGVCDQVFADPAYDLATQLHEITLAEAAGKTILLDGHGSSVQECVFALGCMLLAAGGHATFCVSRNNYAGTSASEPWWKMYETAANLTAARGPFTKMPSGLLRRTFKSVKGGGYVLTVNPTSAQVGGVPPRSATLL